ncbi:hypothetical protein PR048_017015 [Dryococelus australis]|uniref:Uncharacterized protein n=1 Tax=Dryococelus australis TaxID=614101 RepID=A0ABQ9H8C0_9NEOP|nr:hypothetical protein PR048_017015 [Dryococelus australis]
MSACTRQKAKTKYRNRIRLERASQKQSCDTNKTPYDRVKRCREQKQCRLGSKRRTRGNRRKFSLVCLFSRVREIKENDPAGNRNKFIETVRQRPVNRHRKELVVDKGGEKKTPECKGCGRREIPEKARRPAASSGTILTCENPGVTRPGLEPGLPWWEPSSLTAQPPRPRRDSVTTSCQTAVQALLIHLFQVVNVVHRRTIHHTFHVSPLLIIECIKVRRLGQANVLDHDARSNTENLEHLEEYDDNAVSRTRVLQRHKRCSGMSGGGGRSRTPESPSYFKTDENREKTNAPLCSSTPSILATSDTTSYLRVPPTEKCIRKGTVEKVKTTADILKRVTVDELQNCLEQKKTCGQRCMERRSNAHFLVRTAFTNKRELVNPLQCSPFVGEVSYGITRRRVRVAARVRSSLAHPIPTSSPLPGIERFRRALNIEALIADEEEVRIAWTIAGMQGRGKWETAEKIR